MAWIHRRRAIAVPLATVLVLIGTLAIAGFADAAAPTRTFTASLVNPACVAKGVVAPFTVTIKNTSPGIDAEARFGEVR